MRAGPVASSTPGDLLHDGLFFDDADTLRRAAAPFLLDGLAAGEPVVLATAPATAQVLRDVVSDHPLVHVLGQHEVHTRGPEALARIRHVADEHVTGDVRRVRVIGELDVGSTDRDWLEWQRYEAVVNRALTGVPVWAVCVFDTARLPAPVLDAARRAHPALTTPEGRVVNPHAVDPAMLLRSLPVPAEPLEADAPEVHVPDLRDTAALRQLLAAALVSVRAHRDVVEDFLLAADEMTSNGLRHGVAPVSVRVWIGPDRVVCRIDDRGQGWDDPFAGYGPAHGEDLSRGGMGLWLARQLCDHVDISSGPHGSSVRLTLRLDRKA